MIILDITISGNNRARFPATISIGLAFQPLGPGVHFAQLRKRQPHYAATQC
jgi:hypothetical protein